MVTLRRLLFVAVLLLLMLMTGVFAYSNPEPIDIDVGFLRFEQVSMAVAFAIVLALRVAARPRVGRYRAAGVRPARSAACARICKYAEAELRTRQPS